MKSVTTPQFWRLYAKLPKDVRLAAVKAYKLWKDDPRHPGLHFKKIQGQENFYSVRVKEGWRAIGVLHSEVIVWGWIGKHSEYEKQLDD